MEQKNILLVGCGNMGSALREAWRGQMALSIVEPALASNQTESGVRYYASPQELPAIAWQVVVFAVKPQVFPVVLPLYSSLIAQETAVVSIAAGVPLARLRLLLNLPPEQPLLRAMPNLPATLGQGMTGLVGEALASPSQRALLTHLFEATGNVLWVESEAALDALTAISGSGPAYVFHFVEALAAAATQLGFSAHDAMVLARQTLIGSAHLLSQSTKDAGTLRENVTSPGGTTEAALHALRSGDALATLLTHAVQAAQKRAAELAKF
jgi:pyrroline-5-carboxylate reductase